MTDSGDLDMEAGYNEMNRIAFSNPSLRCGTCGAKRVNHDDASHSFTKDLDFTGTASETELRDAAYDYLRKCGMTPNPDAIGQLTEAFLPCLQIICERGYVDPDNPEEHFWLARGWKGIVHDIMDNALRLKFFSWRRNEFYPNGAFDVMNFAGFYVRAGNKGKKWGEIGEPG